MNDYDFDDDAVQAEDKMQLAIDKRKEENEKKIARRLHYIFRQAKDQLKEDDKGFLRARQSYLTDGQRKEYADIINPKVDLLSYSRSQLNDMARELGIDDVDAMKSKTEVIEAINQAKGE